MGNGKNARRHLPAAQRAAARAVDAPSALPHQSRRTRKQNENLHQDDDTMEGEPEKESNVSLEVGNGTGRVRQRAARDDQSDDVLEHPNESFEEEGEGAGIIVGAFRGWKGRDMDYQDSNSDSEEEIEEVLMVDDSLSGESETTHPARCSAAQPRAQTVSTQPQKSTVARPRGRPAKAGTAVALEAPEVIRIPLMVFMNGSENLVMVESTMLFEEVREVVAEKLEKHHTALKLRYRTSWSPNKSDRSSLSSDAEWEFLLENVKAHVTAALRKKANNGIVPPWTISVFNGEDDPSLVRPATKKAGKAKSKETEPEKEVFHGNIYWHEKLQNTHECGNNKHDYPCFVVKTELYEPEIPRGTHLRLTPGILGRWARLLGTHEAGLNAPPDEVLLDIFKANNFSLDKNAADSVYGKTKKAAKKAHGMGKASGYPFQFPVMSLPSLNVFSPFKGQAGPAEGDDDDDELPLVGAKRRAKEAEVDDEDIDGPPLIDWISELDRTNYRPGAFAYDSLMPKVEELRLEYLADLLEFSTKDLAEIMEIPIGVSAFLLRKGKFAMKHKKWTAA